MEIKIIVAIGLGGIIGKEGDLPWPRLKGEQAHFKRETLGDAVLMGRNTWASIPEKYRPLPERLNIVLSTQLEETSLPEGVVLARDVPAAIEAAQQAGHETLWLIGGRRIYEEGFSPTSPLAASEAVITQVQGYYPGDTRLEIPMEGWEQTGELEQAQGWGVIRMRRVEDASGDA